MPPSWPTLWGHAGCRSRGPPPCPPAGTQLRADPTLRRLDAGRTLLGGSPLRIVKLSPAGAAIVERWLAGQPLEAGAAPRRLARRLLDGGLVHPRLSASAQPV